MRENLRDGEERRGEEEEDEEEKKKRSQDKKGMDSMILVWNCMDHWILYEIMCIWTMVRMSMVCKPRVLIGFHPN